MENAVFIRPNDSVVTVTEAVSRGGVVRYPDGQTVTAVQDIPIYHKVAVVEIGKGGAVYKYGEKIGLASADIHVGEHVHTHNLESERA
ncbi:MAG: UxaA family hydrolase [Synergistaceae bacterium]|jgi:altronate dehydratase small subunit|nr:UxaA family hydrolase [Synergistaceae bacterium]